MGSEPQGKWALLRTQLVGEENIRGSVLKDASKSKDENELIFFPFLFPASFPP